MRIQYKEQGFALLMVVVIVGAATLIMAYTAALLGIGELELSEATIQKEEAISLADGCLDIAFQGIRTNSTTYIGETLSLSSGSCIITVEHLSNIRSIIITSTVDISSAVISSTLFLLEDTIVTHSIESL